ncbi:MAG: tetratricopeptide repeat protein [Bryobacterales bacterium]|nr:tetratricopeptide repeat protein [Bryobacterales bacterium]
MWAAGVLGLWLLQGVTPPEVERHLAAGASQKALDRLAETDVRDAAWYSAASRAWDGLNDPAKAVRFAENALGLEPGNPIYHARLGQIFLARNTPKAAFEIFTEAAALFPDNFVVRLGRGLAAKELQLYEDAEHELRWCLGNQPGAPLAFDALATIYVQQARFPDAGALAEAFVKANAGDYRGPYFQAAAREGQQLGDGETLRLVDLSLQRNPRFAAAHALRGKILLKQKKLAEATASLKAAITYRPDLVQAHLLLARAYREAGDAAGAAREFETVRQLKAREQEPRPSLLYHRGGK